MLTARTVTGLQNWTSPDIGGAVSVIALALAPATTKKTVFNFRLAYLTAKSSVVLSCETNLVLQVFAPYCACQLAKERRRWVRGCCKKRSQEHAQARQLTTYALVFSRYFLDAKIKNSAICRVPKCGRA